MPLTRRRFLVLSAATSTAASAALPLACGDKDATSHDDTAGDGGSASLPALALSKEPWVQLLGRSTARLRFETKEARALPVTLGLPDGGEVQATPTLREDQLEYVWDFDLEGVTPDLPGLHVLQEVTFTDLVAGQIYTWSIDLGGGQSRAGSFRAPVAAGSSFRFGWVADTMAPLSEGTATALTGAAPDLILHGGDIVYQTSPTDTWMDFSLTWATVQALAPFHMTPGNHDFEDLDEVHVMFDRLFLPQGDGGQNRYHAFSVGHVRFIHLDTESARYDLADDVADMEAWLQAELQATADDPDLRHAVVVMHRPMFTLSKYWVEDPTDRDRWHALFREQGVPLVLCGHVHAYEHWLVDGVHYVVDGGGGALLYDPVEEREAVEAARPGEAALQLTAIRSYGVSVVDVHEDGTMSFQRLAAETAAVEDSFEISPSASKG